MDLMGPFICLLLLLALAIFVGCDRKDSASAQAPAASEATDPAAPTSPRGLGAAPEPSTNVSVIADTGAIDATLQQLTRELRDYVLRTRSVPKNFDEFAAKSQVQFPAPPAGKKYAIEGQVVVLVKK